MEATGRFEQSGDDETIRELERVERQVQDCVAASLLPEARRVEIERLEDRVRKARTELTRARSRLRLTQGELEFLLETVRDESGELRTSVHAHVRARGIEDANTLPAERLRSGVLRGLLWALLAVNATVGAWVSAQLWRRKRGPHNDPPAGHEKPLEPVPAQVVFMENTDDFVVLEDR